MVEILLSTAICDGRMGISQSFVDQLMERENLRLTSIILQSVESWSVFWCASSITCTARHEHLYEDADD